MDNRVDPGPSNIRADIFRAELSEIAARRARMALEIEKHDGEAQDPDNVTDNLVGLALSGGGIRSATFNLGVVQELARRNVFRYIDYLSTVSGGGYLGCSISAQFSGAKSTYNSEFLDGHTNRIVSRLRSHSNYLAPGGLLDAL